MSTQVTDYTDVLPKGQKAVLLFWAPWHEDSAEGGSWDMILRALADSTDSNAVQFGRVQAEDCAVVCNHYGVSVVPTFILLKSNGKVFEKVEGGEDVSKVTVAVQRLLQSTDDDDDVDATAASGGTDGKAPSLSPEEVLTQRLDKLIRSNEVMLFMKGTPDAPRCGFSRQAVGFLQDEQIPFGSFDILSDEDVRQGLKKHSNWPTYPQLYVKGELVGGLDIMKETKESGTLREELGISSAKAPALKTLEERLGELVTQQPIMLFMKGLPSAPRCGFSRQMVEILDEQDVAYGAFNILEDEEVRQGLKTYSNWPTYPQLYVNGELVGGLDIVKELKEDGSLKETLKGST